jgi:hypothetical protein
VNANAVARFSVGGHGAPMREAREGSQSLREDVMRGLVVESGDKSDAARFEVETRIDEAFTRSSTLAGDPKSGPGAAGRQGRFSTISRSHIQL